MQQAKPAAISGRITQISGASIRTSAEPDRLRTVSIFADPAPVIPPVGTDVLLTLDRQGFIRDIVALSAPGAPSASSTPVGSRGRAAPAFANTPPATRRAQAAATARRAAAPITAGATPAGAPVPALPAGVGRDTRLVCLQAAARFCAGRSPREVLGVAAVWARWVEDVPA